MFHPAVGYTSGDIYTESLRDITRWNMFVSARPAQFLRVEGVRDFERVKTTGKIGIVIGQQNSEHFRTVEDVDRFYALGQRVSQLTYHGNRIGGGSSDTKDIGLTLYARRPLSTREMNRVGMAIDVSHCADRTTLEAIEASSRPVLVTHSNCRSLVACARCKPDEAIRSMAAKGGVMGVTMVRGFASERGVTTIDAVLDHIDHIAALVGVEHVGLGSDVDLDGRDAHTPRKYDLRTGHRLFEKGFRSDRGAGAPELFERGYPIDSGWEFQEGAGRHLALLAPASVAVRMVTSQIVSISPP